MRNTPLLLFEVYLFSLAQCRKFTPAVGHVPVCVWLRRPVINLILVSRHRNLNVSLSKHVPPFYLFIHLLIYLFIVH